MMRWEYEELWHGKTRIREGFLWMPRQIGYEVRWLERARWEEQFDEGTWAGGLGWHLVRWVD